MRSGSGETADSPFVDSWRIMPSELQICRRPDGSEWLLGEGSFGKVRAVRLRAGGSCAEEATATACYYVGFKLLVKRRISMSRSPPINSKGLLSTLSVIKYAVIFNIPHVTLTFAPVTGQSPNSASVITIHVHLCASATTHPLACVDVPSR